MTEDRIDMASGTGCVPGAHGEVRAATYNIEIEKCTFYQTITLDYGAFDRLVAALREARLYVARLQFDDGADETLARIDAALEKALTP